MLYQSNPSDLPSVVLRVYSMLCCFCVKKKTKPTKQSKTNKNGFWNRKIQLGTKTKQNKTKRQTNITYKTKQGITAKRRRERKCIKEQNADDYHPHTIQYAIIFYLFLFLLNAVAPVSSLHYMRYYTVRDFASVVDLSWELVYLRAVRGWDLSI